MHNNWNFNSRLNMQVATPANMLLSSTWMYHTTDFLIARNKWLDQLQNDSTCPTGEHWKRAVDRSGARTRHLAGCATKMTMTMMLLFWILVYILATTLVSLNVCMYLSEHWSRARDANGWNKTKTLTVFIKTRRDVDMSWSSLDHNLKTRGFVWMCMFF